MMHLVMNLNEEQKALVSKWISEGASLAEVQSRLREELKITVTYMEARLLMAELNLVPVEKQVETPESSSLAGEDAAGGHEADIPEETLPSGGVSVTIDRITKPNAMISGKVTFSDGNHAEWFLDGQGRLALNPSTPGYRPSQADITAFQTELQRAAQSQGL